MTERELFAIAVRDACVRVAIDAYEDAGIRGLCAEGRWEHALDAMRGFEPAQTIERVPTDES